jgi:hypothetical protein
MTKARFDQAEVQSAISAFISNTAPRTAPAIGKNSEVTVYGVNTNKYKPILPKLENDDGEIQGLID